MLIRVALKLQGKGWTASFYWSLEGKETLNEQHCLLKCKLCPHVAFSGTLKKQRKYI